MLQIAGNRPYQLRTWNNLELQRSRQQHMYDHFPMRLSFDRGNGSSWI